MGWKEKRREEKAWAWQQFWPKWTYVRMCIAFGHHVPTKVPISNLL